jgi:putative membrane protein
MGAICALVAASANAAPTAQDFVTKASIAGRFEIESSKLALTKSSNPDVKAFAQQMIDDHTQASQDLAVAAKPSGAQPADALDDKHQKKLDKLNDLSGKKFDKEYISCQTKAHKKAVSLFSDYAKSGDDASLKDFASKTLPTLQGHLDHVKKLKAK